jgi:hypothetical protein
MPTKTSILKIDVRNLLGFWDSGKGDELGA